MLKYSWYALRVLGGKEKKIKEDIERSFDNEREKSFLKNIFVPFQRVYRVKRGKREIRKKHFGYMLVEIDLSADGVKDRLINVPGVLGFVVPDGFGRRKDPIPLSDFEISNMLGKADKSEAVSSASEGLLQEGDDVEIVEGAFQGHKAVVQKADSQSKKIEVLVQIFKKDTKLELNYNQVKKLLK